VCRRILQPVLGAVHCATTHGAHWHCGPRQGPISSRAFLRKLRILVPHWAAVVRYVVAPPSSAQVCLTSLDREGRGGVLSSRGAMPRKAIVKEVAAEGNSVADEAVADGDDEVVLEGTLVCALTGEHKVATPQEETLQSFIEQLHREYGFELSDM